MLAKIIAGVIGWQIYGPLGALIAVLVVHQFGGGLGSFLNPLSSAERQRIQETFFTTLFSLVGHLAKSDGHISPAEIAHAEGMMTRMGLVAERRREAIALFQDGAAADFSLDQCLERFVDVCARQQNLKRQLISYLISLALVDGEFHAAEERILRRIAERLGFPPALFDQLIAMIGAQTQFGNDPASGVDRVAAAYVALGVDEQVSDAALKKAYRKLISQNHPDKLIGQGMPDDMVKIATERTQEIQTAYDLLVKSRAGG